MSQIQTQNPLLTVRDSDHIRGPEDAPVTLVQYGDFECPFCRDMQPVIRRIQNRIGTRLRLVFRHFPLNDQHAHAQKAAKAAEAAAAQDEKKFWEMHDLLYEYQNTLTQDDLKEYATDIGLDVHKFTQELNGHKYWG